MIAPVRSEIGADRQPDADIRDRSGHRMIHSIEISNFRCFRHLYTEKCPRFNIIVGDNGTGKTNLLEAIFFALGSSPEMAIRYRGQRGLGASFTGSPFRIEEV